MLILMGCNKIKSIFRCFIFLLVIATAFGCRESFTPVIVYCDLSLREAVTPKIIDFEGKYKNVRVLLAFDSSKNLSSICSLMQDCNLFIGTMEMGHGYMDSKYVASTIECPNTPFNFYLCDFTSLKSKEQNQLQPNSKLKYLPKRQLKFAKLLATYLSNEMEFPVSAASYAN